MQVHEISRLLGGWDVDGRGTVGAVGRGWGGELLLLRLLLGGNAVHLSVPGRYFVDFALGWALDDSTMRVHEIRPVVKLHRVGLIDGGHGRILERDTGWALDDHGARSGAAIGRTRHDRLKMECAVVVSNVVSKRRDVWGASQDVVDGIAGSGREHGRLSEIIVGIIVWAIVAAVIFFDGARVDNLDFTREDHLEGFTSDGFFNPRKAGAIAPLV